MSTEPRETPEANHWVPRHAEFYRVPFGDTDAAGIVFYPNYFRWFDRMTHELFRSLGQELLRWGQSKQGPVIVETGCHPTAPVRYDEIVKLEAGIAEVREKSFRIEHRISRDEHVTTTGYEVRVWASLDGDSIQAIPLPDELKRALSGQ